MLRRGTEMPSPFEVVARISHAVIHPQYVDKGFANDIALLKMEKPVQFRQGFSIYTLFSLSRFGMRYTRNVLRTFPTARDVRVLPFRDREHA